MTALVAALVCVATSVAAQSTSALELLIREAGTARPLTDATVRIVGTGQFALTDPTGHALMLRVPVGHHAVEVRHPGHAPYRVQLDFADGMVTQLQVALEIQPVEMEGIEVTAEAQFARLRRAGFYQRQRGYGGDFLGPEDMVKARIGGTSLSNLMRGRLGITVIPTTSGGHVLASSRSGNQPCPTAVFIDGVRQYAVDDMDRLISMMDVEAIEIYGDRLATPVQFEVRGHCGAVVIWTPVGR